MSKISIKTDFKNGDILPDSDLNNNFRVIEAGINANEENLQEVIDEAIIRLDHELEEITADRGWDWNGGERVTFFKGTTTQIDDKPISNGQLLYNTETGETALDDANERIVTGSGNVIAIDDDEPTNPATKLWIDPTEALLANVGTEIQSGSNENGNWIKFADGTMICTKIVSGTTTFIEWANNIYFVDISNGDWAQEFTQLLSVQANNTTSAVWVIGNNATTTSAGYSRLVRPDSGGAGGQPYNVNLLAIGRWK